MIASGAATVPASRPSTLKKVSFGAVAKKKEDTTKDYPVFDDPTTNTQVLDIAARIKRRSGEIEALEGAQKTDKAELRLFVTSFYFHTNHGKAEVPSSIAIPSDAGEVLVTYQNRYTKIVSEDPLVPILGDRLGDYFRQSFTLKIPGEALPVGHEQAIVDGIAAVLAQYGAKDALEVDESIKPTPDFHTARHRDFTPEVNLQIEEACPIVAMIKTKGRGK